MIDDRQTDAIRLSPWLLALAGWRRLLVAQEPGKTKDDALDSLLENSEGPAKTAAKSAKKAAKPAAPTKAKARASRPATTKKVDEPRRSPSKSGGKQPARAGAGQDQAGAQTAGGGQRLRPRIRRSTICSGNWARPRMSRPREERPRNQAGGGGQPPAEQKPGQKDGPKLGGKDKEIDERLEELAGRKRKRSRMPTTKSEAGRSAR